MHNDSQVATYRVKMLPSMKPHVEVFRLWGGPEMPDSETHSQVWTSFTRLGAQLKRPNNIVAILGFE